MALAALTFVEFPYLACFFFFFESEQKGETPTIHGIRGKLYSNLFFVEITCRFNGQKFHYTATQFYWRNSILR